MSTLTIRLPDEKMTRLREAASASKKSTNALVEEALDAYLPTFVGPSIADALQDYIGAIDGPAIDASQVSEVFGQILQEKRRLGHL